MIARRRLLGPLRFFFSSRRRHTRLVSDWSSDVYSSDLALPRWIADRPDPQHTGSARVHVKTAAGGDRPRSGGGARMCPVEGCLTDYAWQRRPVVRNFAADRKSVV